jgi:photosystem II stability/assembly factor-like uncharacterized protein
MKKKIIISILFSVALMYSNGQLPLSPELKTALQNKNGFSEVMQTVTDYYSQKGYTKDSKLFSEFKKWNRWGWYMGSHLNTNGQFVNISERNWAASQQTLAQRNLNPNTQNRPLSNSGVWASIGPYTITQGAGRADRLAFHPTNANIIYAGTPAAGLWRTLDGGANWHALNGFMPNIGVSGIVIDRDNPNTIYILTGDGDSNIPGGFVLGFGYIRPSIGILKSTDGGSTWSKLSDIIAPGTIFYGFKLVQSEDFHNRFFACTSDGLYRSTDFGQTWSRDNTIGIDPVYDLELGPANSGYVYACTDRRVYISANWGNPFEVVSNTKYSSVPTTNDRTALAVSANAPNRLYVSFGKDNLLYMSENNGTDYTLVNPNSPTTQAYMAALAVSPGNANIVIIGEINLQRSATGGTGFAVVGSGIVHADVHELQFNPLNNFLYAACDGGVYRSTDQGATWVSLFNGMQTTQFYHFTGVNGNNNLILGGAQDNGNIQSSDNAGSYQLVFGGDGFESAYLNGNNNQYYFTTNTFLTRGTRTPAGNVNATPPGATGFYPTVAIHPANDQIVYAGYTNGVFRSDDGAATWTNKGNQGSAGGSPAGGLAVSANTPDRIYAANSTTLWKSDNKGDIWTTISGTAGWPGASTATPITDITSRSSNGNEIWITFGGYTAGRKVFYSNNSGASWTNFSGSLPNMPVYCIKYTSDGNVYIGTEIGVYFMGFAMNDWVPFYNGLPVVPVADLFINEINGTIRAGTFGRGIWQSDLYSDCGPFIFLGGVTQGANFYQSGGFIETTQQIPGSYGNQLRLRSPTKIILKPGFSIRNNAYMHAVIGNCGQGVFNRADSNGTAISKGAYLKMNVQMKE